MLTISGPGSTARLLADVHAAPHSKNAIPAVEAVASESHTRLAPLVDGAAASGQSVAVIRYDITKSG